MHWLAIAIVLILAMLLAIREVGSSDVGFHLKAGSHILEHRTWPRTDQFTYTLRDRPYIDTSWGYQVLIASVEKKFHAGGLVALHAGMILATLVLVLMTARLFELDATWLVILLVLGVFSSEMRYEVRPELLSHLFLAWLIFVLTRHAQRRTSPLWTVPLIHLAWANCHSLFLLGWLAMGSFVVGLWLRDRRIDRRLLVHCLVAIAVCFINPYFVQGVSFPISLLSRFDRSNVFSETIGEFASPFDLRLTAKQPFFPVWAIYSFRAFSVFGVLTVWFMIRHRRYWGICLLAAMLLLAAKMQRNMPLFVVTMLPLMAAGPRVDWLLRLFRLKERGLFRAHRLILSFIVAIIAAQCLRVVNDAYYIDGRRTQRFGWSWGRLDLPVDAAEYANRVGLRGPLLNHLNLGGYLMWALPDPVFIDGRLEVVGEEFFQRYREIMVSSEALESARRHFHFEWIIFPYGISQQLLKNLSTDSVWRLAYVDHYCAIFVRNATGAERFVDPRINRPPADEAVEMKSLPGLGGPPRQRGFNRWLTGCVQREVFPYEDEFRGLFHLFRGELPAAERRFARAIQISRGRYHELYQNLAAVLIRQNRLSEAAACYRIVLEDEPGNRIARDRLAALPSTGEARK